MTTRTKQPGETLWYTMEFANLLDTGDSLATVSSIESAPVGLTITDEYISDTNVIFKVAGGSDGATYHLEITVTTDGGETLEGDGYLYVTDTPEYALTFNYNYTSIRVAIADYLGWGRNTEGTGTGWADTDSYRMDSIIKSALAQVYYPEGGHTWSWLRPTSSFTTNEPYNTGTIEVVSGVVTLTGGTWPSWAEHGDLEVDGEIYAVDSRDGNTQLTLVDTDADVSAGSTYTLSRYLYDLPTDFRGFEGQLTYGANSSVLYPPIEHVSDSMVRKARQQRYCTSWPRQVSIRPAAYDATEGQRWQAAFYPTPDATYQLQYRYKVEPQMLSDAYPNPMGGPEVGELVLEACLAIAEQRYKDEAGLHTEAFRSRLAAAIEHDVRSYTPDTLGYNADRSDRAESDRFDGIAIHSFEGTTYYDRNL